MLDENIQFYDRFVEFYDFANPRQDSEFQFHRIVAAGADSLLEVACGSGTLTVPLTQVVAHCEGLDAAPGMLEVARKRLPQTRFHLGDMRDFDLGTKFDRVVCPFNSFLHLTVQRDAVSALRCMAAHCKPSGQVVIDICNVVPDFVPREIRGAILNEFKDPDTGASFVAREDSDFDRAALTFHIRWRIEAAGSGSLVASDSFTMRQYLPDEMMDMCKSAGLEVTARYGCHSLSAFAPLSPRHIIIARPISNTRETPQ
ncbi:MAG: class I SAM-dependent methyltransferase [Paracoccaceae bacterium]